MSIITKAANALGSKLSNVGSAKSKGLNFGFDVPFAESQLEKFMQEYEGVRTTLRDHLGCAQPTHDPYKLLALKSASGYHSYALHTKSVLSTGLGYEASPRLLPHLKQANEKESFQKVLNFWSKNLETFGTAYLHIIRGAGTVNFYAMPSVNMRIKPSDHGEIDKILEYQYAIGTGQMAYAWHDPFGYGVQEGIDIFKFDSLTGNKYYGDPEYDSIIKTLSINLSFTDVLMKFFDNSMMSNMAIIMKGGDLDEEEKKKVKEYLTTQMKGVHNAFKVLFLEVGPEEDVKFEKLSAEMDFKGFIALRKLFREEEAAGNHLQPREIGIVEAGSLGGQGEGDTQMKKTKITFSDPRQQDIEEYFQILFDQAGLPDPESFKLKRMDVSAGTEPQANGKQPMIINNPNIGDDEETEKAVATIMRGMNKMKSMMKYAV
jgi:hypothetical protein